MRNIGRKAYQLSKNSKTLVLIGVSTIKLRGTPSQGVVTVTVCGTQSTNVEVVNIYSSQQVYQITYPVQTKERNEKTLTPLFNT